MDPQPTTPGHGSILVVGAGAIGGFFGALLARRGRDVTFLVRPPRAAALRQHGLRVTGQGHDYATDVKVVTSQDLAGPFDLVVLSVKATGLAATLDDLTPAVGPDTAVVPFLNGLDHMWVLNERFGPQRVLGGVVVVATTLAGDGTIVQLAPGASLTIGEQGGPPTARTEEIAALLSDAGFTFDVTSDIVSAMWRKWVFIASIGALTCLFRGTIGEVAAAPGGSEVGPAILGEAASVAAAAGHPLPPPDRDGLIRLLTDPGSAMTSSLYRDLQAGRDRDLAAAVGIAPTTALDRTRSLRQRGVIRGALLDVDLAAIGRPVQALIAVRIRPPSRRNIEAFRDWAARLPDTVDVFVVSGSEDFLLHVAVADNQHLYAFVIDKLTERPEVADVRTSVIYEHLRNPAIVPDPAARA